MPKSPGKSELKVEYSSRTFTVPKNLEYEFVIYEREMEYTFMHSKNSTIRYLRSLHDVIWWNTIMCLSVLAAIVMVMVEDYQKPQRNLRLVDAVFNLLYAVHVVAVAFIIYHRRSRVTVIEIISFLVDALTFTHYLIARTRTLRLLVYCVRLHRPLQYQWSNSNYNIKSSIWGTAFKISYLNFVLRIGWTVIWIYVHELMHSKSKVYALNQTATTTTSTTPNYDDLFIQPSREAERKELKPKSVEMLLQNYTMEQFTALYFQINRMYVPVGTTMDLSNDVGRVLCVLVQMTGSLMLSGAAIATLSLVFSIYLAPEEDFRSRYRLIMKELKNSRVTSALREKVETFYMIYWKKHNAVSSAELIPILPPTLTSAINFDIYFEATQKSRMLKDTPNHFLTEVMKSMTTTHYIPGDTIIGRGSTKHSMYYITYGDIEMLTAEDDNTAVLRMSRGTVLTPCSPCTVVSCGTSHVQIRAATFCTAQVLSCPVLWKKTLRATKRRGRSAYLLWAFNDHLDKVKLHYSKRYHPEVQHLSSIKAFKQGLIALKNATDSNGELLMPREDVFLEIAGCYITRSDIESTLTDESDAICLRQRFPCILQPSSSLLNVWHGFVAILTVVVVITHPYFMAFTKEISASFYYFDRVVTIVYIIDLVVFLSTATNIEEGVVITFSNTALNQMRKPRFVIDVLATLPIFEFIHDGHFGGVNKLLKIPQLFNSLKSVEDNCVYHNHVLRFGTFTLLVVLMCYLIAFVQQATMCFGFKFCNVRNFTHTPYWQATPLNNDDVEDQVTFNLYWAVAVFTLTSHMFEYVKDKLIENVYSITFLEIVLGIRLFIEASYSATIMVTSAMRLNFDSFIDTVKDFLVRKEIDSLLRDRFITYLELCWYTDSAYAITHQKHSIFYDLPAHVYQDIVAKQRSSYLLCIPFMKLFHRAELRAIASRARLFYTSPNEILLSTGDFTDEIFVVKQGICEMLCPVSRQSVRLLKSKSHFGSMECIMKFPAYYTFRAVTHVQILSVKRRLFFERCHDIPQIRDVIDYAKASPEYAALQQHTFRSFAKYQYPEVPPNRQIFKQRRKFEQDFEFLLPFTQLGFLSVLRYIFPRFTIRPDSKYLERYEWFRAACALLTSIVFPSYEYMVLHIPEISSLAKLLDMTAYFDMIQRTIIGFYNEKGILIYHPSSTLAHYLRGAFIVDLLACVPLEHLQPLGTEGDRYRLDMLRQGLMLNRLLQLYRFFQTIEALHVYLRQDIMLVLKSLPLFVTLVNVLTVFIVLTSATIVFPKVLDKSSNATYWIIPLDDRGGSWINLYSGVYRFNITENVVNYHLAVYFWVVYETTSTGFGTIMPSNHRIMEVLFVGMVISCMITIYFSVRVISVRSNINVALCSFQEHKKDMQAYMMREKLDENLRRLVRNYYDYNWDNMGGVETRSLLKLCDQVSLRTDCILHIYGATFQECPILPNNDMSLMRVLSRSIRDAYFVKKMEIMITDDVIRHLYFVSSGTIHIRIQEKKICKVIKLNRGSVFGNFERNAIRSPATAVANTDVHLLQIKSRMFHDVTKDCPKVIDLMAKHRPHKEMYISTVSRDMRGQRRVKRKTLSTITVTETVQTKFRTEDFRISIFLALITYFSMSYEVYNICFQMNSHRIIIFLYTLDVLFSFKIAFLVWVPNSKEAHKFRAMRLKYLKAEFAYDLISCIPIELFAFLLDSSRWFWFSWLRIGRFFRVITLYKCMRRKRKKLSTNLAASTVLTVAVWFTLCIHVISCVFHYIGTLEDQKTPNSSWQYGSNGKTVCNDEYICAIYFIMTTFTHNGVGDIMPGKHSEVIIVAALEIISTMMYMVFVGEFSNIVQYESYRSFTFYSLFLQLKAYLKNNRVSDHLIDVIRLYCLHLWRESRGHQMPHFLTFAPLPLKLQVMTAAYLHHLDRHPVFRHCEPAFLRQLTGCLKLFTYNEDLMIVKENEITDSMYFIHQGTVQESSDKEGIQRIYVTREYFGEGLNRNEPYRYSYQSIHKSQILMLQLHDWEYLLDHFPRSRAAIYGGPIPEESQDDDSNDGDDLEPGATGLSTLKDDNLSLAPSELMENNSSSYSFNSRLIDFETAESRTSTFIRFTGRYDSIDMILPRSSTSSDRSTQEIVSPAAVPTIPEVGRPSRVKIKSPLGFRRPTMDNTGFADILRKLKGKQNEQDLFSENATASSSHSQDHRINLELTDLTSYFSDKTDTRPSINLSDTSTIYANMEKEFEKLTSSKMSLLDDLPEVSPNMEKTLEKYTSSKMSLLDDLPEVSPNKEKALEKYTSSKMSLLDDSLEVSPNRQVIYLRHKASSSSSKNQIPRNTDKINDDETKELIEQFIAELLENIMETVFQNVDGQDNKDESDDEKFEVFMQGKAFDKSDKKIDNKDLIESKNSSLRIQVEDDDMVEIFVDNEHVIPEVTNLNEQNKEDNENARIRAFAASQAAKDGRKRLFDPVSIKNRKSENDNFGHRSLASKMSFSVQRTESEEIDENKKIKALAASQLLGDEEKKHGYTMYPSKKRKIEKQESSKNQSKSRTMEVDFDDVRSQTEAINFDEIEKKPNKIESGNIEYDVTGQDEKFSVFLQGKAFGKATNIPKSITEKVESLQLENPSVISEDKGIFMEVLVQGKAFENSAVAGTSEAAKTSIASKTSIAGETSTVREKVETEK